MVPARSIIGYNNKQHHQFMETYCLKKGLKHFLNTTKDDILRIKANYYGRINWHLDAPFGVHENLRSHTGPLMTFMRYSYTINFYKTERQF
jgi:transcriptional antiterminator